MTLPAHQLGWVAGILDLKGRIIYKNNKTRTTRQITLMVETKEYTVVRALGRLTGTNPEFRDQSPLADWMRRGCSEHCPEQHIHVNDSNSTLPPMARWTMTGASMVTVLDNVAPFLMIERGYEAATAEAIANTTLVGQGANMTVKSLRRLHQLGWDLPEIYASALDGPPAAITATADAA